MIHWKTLSSLTLVFLLAACTAPPVKIDFEDRKIIDSLYKSEAKGISSSIDSICNYDRERKLREAIDSIYKFRLSERSILMDELNQ